MFDDFVVVLDAPLRSAAGEDLLAAVRAHAPDKEIRYAVFGHHHPHYSGGLRPLIHAGATIVTTAGNVPLIEDLARRPYALAPDALAREPRAPKFLVVDGKHVFSDASGRALELHDIGAYTEHTDSYLVYYFPRERLLIEGRPGLLPCHGRGAARAAGGAGARASDRRSQPRRGEDRPDLAARRPGAGRRTSAAGCDPRRRSAVTSVCT
ncbi:hypothetical protein [Nannocystis pusilla]|uniref:hypothetical protein n=1 Tax=Nannocystis pusilla TaxID=889268 RepID=UPI003BF06B3A